MLVIDLRCLQDTRYAERGIGSHARCAVFSAPEPFLGLVDPELPELPPEVAARAAGLVPHGYVPGATRFLNPSPMSPNQNFVARLLLDARVRKAALVYDFIPHDDRARYLAHPVTRLDHDIALAWLARYDAHLAISEPAAARLRALLGATAGVTGVALPGWADNLAPAGEQHILMIGGDDARKNPEILLRAHGASGLLRNIPLVITGAAPLAPARNLVLPGRVTETQLRDFYAQALCVVVPSRAEGFSLPVIEAMAAQKPVFCSDIPAHRALVPDAALRFAPDDSGALQTLLERAATDAHWRRQLVAAQAGVAQQFTARAVAARIWDENNWGKLPARPGLRRRPRLALISPMPPVKSGCADYSAACARELGKIVDLTVMAEHYSALPYLSGKHDAVVSVIGNAPPHAKIHDLFGRHGSAVVCHDARLLGLATVRGLAPAAAMAAGELKREVTDAEILAWATDERLRAASFLGGLVAARPLIFHSPAPVALMRERFGVEAKFLPFAVYRPMGPMITPAMRAAARAALALGPEKRLVSFGFLAANKGISRILEAFARLRPGDTRLVFLGEEGDKGDKYRAEAAALGIARHVDFPGQYVPEALYQKYLLAADGAIQLREGGVGHISGTLQDCIAAGLPAVANRDLAENLAAPDYVSRVDDALEPAEIARALADMLDARQDTEAARQAYGAAHGMAAYAKALLALLGLD